MDYGANPFDQFDGDESPAAGNVFDQFDEDGEPSVTSDAAKSLGTGVVRGTASLAGLPGDALSYIQGLGRRLGDQIFGETTPEMAAKLSHLNDTRILPTSAEIKQAGTDATGITLHEPETRAGRYAETVGEFIPAVVAGGTKLIPDVLKFAVAPGIASEAAGELTEGTPIEPIARTVAAVGTGGVAALASRPGTPAAALRQSIPKGMTEADVTAAGQLMRDARARGVGLTWPEALAQVTGRRVDMTDMQRVIEQTKGGRPVMSEFMAERPAQVRGAMTDELAGFGPAGDPVRTGLKVQDISEKALTTLRQRINRATEPLYRSGGQKNVHSSVYTAIAKDPLFKRAVREIRNDPLYARSIAGFPDRSVQVFDAVKKHLDDLAGAAERSGQNYASATYGGLARDVRDAAKGASSEYKQAIERQAVYRQNVLEPAETGPLGRMAETPHLRSQTETLFPDSPLAGSEGHVGQAVRRLVRKDPHTATRLVRSHLASAFDEAAQANIGGANQFGGAKFVAKVFGNHQQAKNIRVAVLALPAGTLRWQGLRRLMDVFEATGKRQPANSATEFNRRLTNELERGGIAGNAATLAASPGSVLTYVRDFYRDFRLGKNSEALARIITSPGSEWLLARLLSAKTLTERQRAAAILLTEGQSELRKPATQPPRITSTGPGTQ